MRIKFILAIVFVFLCYLLAPLQEASTISSEQESSGSTGEIQIIKTESNAPLAPIIAWPVFGTDEPELQMSIEILGETVSMIPADKSPDLSLFWQPEDRCSDGLSLFGQPPPDPGDPFSAGISDLDANVYIYDNFVDGGWITAVNFWGTHLDMGGGGNPCEENPMDFGIGFFENVGGNVGPSIAIFYQTASEITTGQSMGMAGPLYYYSIVLDTPVYIEEAFLSIVGTNGIDCNFAWISSGAGMDGHSWQYYTSDYHARSYDQAFCLVNIGCPDYSTFSQPPYLPGDPGTFYTSDADMVPQLWRVYDNVELTYMESLRFWGITGHFDEGWIPCEENPMIFEIKFYYDDGGGQPGVVYFSETVTLTGQPTELEYYTYTSKLYEYEAFFGPTKVFDGWLSVQAIGGDPACSFLWGTSRAGLDDASLQWDETTLSYVPHSYDMSFCILGEEPCCGFYTAGFTGNTNCDIGGLRDLADITRLIDNVYISKTDLCCDDNGNVNGDSGGLINLADITRLIDHVYITKVPTAACD